MGGDVWSNEREYRPCISEFVCVFVGVSGQYRAGGRCVSKPWCGHLIYCS